MKNEDKILIGEVVYFFIPRHLIPYNYLINIYKIKSLLNDKNGL
jgi:hypothetical protein